MSLSPLGPLTFVLLTSMDGIDECLKLAIRNEGLRISGVSKISSALIKLCAEKNGMVKGN